MPTTSQPCKYQFLDDDGHCPKCGQNHFSRRRTSPVPTVTRIPSPTPQPMRSQQLPLFEVTTTTQTPPKPVSSPAPTVVVNTWPNHPYPSTPVAAEPSGPSFLFVKSFVTDLVNRLCNDWGISVKIDWHNGMKTCVRKSNDLTGRTRITFGLEHLAIDFTKGFKEYASLEYVFSLYSGSSKHPTGRRALAWVVMHEFAHVMVRAFDKRLYNDVHGSTFQHYYKELLDDNREYLMSL